VKGWSYLQKKSRRPGEGRARSKKKHSASLLEGLGGGKEETGRKRGGNDQ